MKMLGRAWQTVQGVSPEVIHSFQRTIANSILNVLRAPDMGCTDNEGTFLLSRTFDHQETNRQTDRQCGYMSFIRVAGVNPT